MKKNLLVTGGSGFIGVNLLKELSKLKKYKITATYFKAKNFYKVNNKMKYKHFIIGSGIAGLHIALQLLDKNETDFLIVEKDDFNKSKIFSIKNTVLKKDGTSDNVLIEMGPSVFHDKQVELMKLLKKLELEHTFDYVDPKSKAYFVYPGMSSEEAKKLWKELKKKVFELTDENITLEEGAKKVLTKNEYKL